MPDSELVQEPTMRRIDSNGQNEGEKVLGIYLWAKFSLPEGFLALRK
jgi:hypothetical protein